MNHLSKGFLLTFFMIVLNTCTSNKEDLSSPEGTLSRYISLSFATQSIEDKTQLEKLLTGDALKQLSEMSEAEFKKTFIDSGKKFRKLSIKERNSISAEESNFTYELSFTQQAGEKEVDITTRKICDFVKIDNKWYIKGVRSLKKVIEYQGEMSLP